MKQIKLFQIIATAGLIATGLMAQNANAQSVTVNTSGTMTAACAIDQANVTIPISGNSIMKPGGTYINTAGAASVAEGSAAITFTCSQGSSVTIDVPDKFKTVSVGGVSAKVSYGYSGLGSNGLFRDGVLTYVSDGTTKSLTVTAIVEATDGKNLPAGSFTTSAPLTMVLN